MTEPDAQSSCYRGDNYWARLLSIRGPLKAKVKNSGRAWRPDSPPGRTSAATGRTARIRRGGTAMIGSAARAPGQLPAPARKWGAVHDDAPRGSGLLAVQFRSN